MMYILCITIVLLRVLHCCSFLRSTSLQIEAAFDLKRRIACQVRSERSVAKRTLGPAFEAEDLKMHAPRGLNCFLHLNLLLETMKSHRNASALQEAQELPASALSGAKLRSLGRGPPLVTQLRPVGLKTSRIEAENGPFRAVSAWFWQDIQHLRALELTRDLERLQAGGDPAATAGAAGLKQVSGGEI